MSVLRFYLVIARAWGWSGTDGARVLRSFVDLARKHSYKVTWLLGKFVEIMHGTCAGCLSAQRCWPGGASLSVLNHGVRCCLQDLYRNCSCRVVGQEIWGVLLSPASSPRRGLGVGSSDSSRSQKWALEAVSVRLSEPGDSRNRSGRLDPAAELSPRLGFAVAPQP